MTERIYGGLIKMSDNLLSLMSQSLDGFFSFLGRLESFITGWKKNDASAYSRFLFLFQLWILNNIERAHNLWYKCCVLNLPRQKWCRPDQSGHHYRKFLSLNDGPFWKEDGISTIVNVRIYPKSNVFITWCKREVLKIANSSSRLLFCI